MTRDLKARSALLSVSFGFSSKGKECRNRSWNNIWKRSNLKEKSIMAGVGFCADVFDRAHNCSFQGLGIYIEKTVTGWNFSGF